MEKREKQARDAAFWQCFSVKASVSRDNSAAAWLLQPPEGRQAFLARERRASTAVACQMAESKRTVRSSSMQADIRTSLLPFRVWL